MELAIARLNQETDIRTVLTESRVSRFLNKATFLARQRKAIDFSRRYVITDLDIERDTVEETGDKDWAKRAEVVI